MHDATDLEDEVDDMYIHADRHIEKETDKKADRPIDRQTNKHKYQQAHEHTCTRLHNRTWKPNKHKVMETTLP